MKGWSQDSESLAAMPTEEEMSKMFDGLKPEALGKTSVFKMPGISMLTTLT